MKKVVKSSKNVPQYVIEEVPENLGKIVTTADEYIVKTKVEKDGRVGEILTKQIKDVGDEIRAYKTSDFYLENLIACGAIDSLKPCQFYDNDVDSVLGQVENLISDEK